MTDQGAPGLDAGDTVTWDPGTGSHLAAPGNLTFGTDAFLSIGSAITASSNGDVIEVSTGTFTENITINKQLTLLGANSGFAGSDGVDRTAETTIQTVGNQNAVATIASGSVIIDGFTIDGNDPSVVGGTLASGDDANVFYGVLSAGAFSNLTVKNNIVTHASIGFRGDGAASGNLITQNWFDSLGSYDFGYAVTLRTNFYADVTDNLMTRVWTGVHTNNFSQAGPATWTVSGNTIHSYAAGIWDNLQYQAATSLTIDHNTISAETGAQPKNIGVFLVSIQDAVGVHFTNNAISGTDYGIQAWNDPTSNTITLDSTNTISGAKLAALDLTDNLASSPIGTTTFGIGVASSLTINGLHLGSATGAGIIIDASGGTATGLSIAGSPDVSGGATGLSLIGSFAGITGNSLGALTFTGQSGNYIQLSSGALHGSTLDATGVSFDGHTGATATLAQNFAIEDKITHAMDDASLGFVRVEAGNVFVTTSSGSIQRGIDLASTNDIVNVAAGNYSDNLVFNKAVTLLGAGDGTNPATSTILTAAVTTSPVVTLNVGGADATHRLSIDSIRLTGTTAAGNSGSGVLVQNGASYLTFDHLAAESLGGNGIALSQNATSLDVVISNSSLSNNAGDGLRLSTTSGIDGLTISNSNFDGNAYGFESYAVAGSSNPLTNVQITNTTFSNDTFKGFYAEKLDHATLDHVTVTNSGTGASSPAGIDINLKYADFSNITLSNSTITNSGTGTAGGLGLTIKARDDAPSYNTNPATLTGVTLTNDSITGSPTDLAIGNQVTGLAFAGLLLGGTGLGLTYYAMPAQALSVGDASFAGTLSTYLFNQTANSIDATAATFGGVTGATATLAQNFATEDKIIHAVDNATLGLVRVEAGNIFVTTSSGSIQRGIDLASTNDIVNVGAGNYSDNLIFNKAVTLSGAGDGTNPATSTILTAAVTTSPVVTLNVGGADATHRLSIEGIRLTGTTAAGNSGSGVLIQNGASYLTFDHVAAESLGGNGISLSQNATSLDVVISNSSLSNNAGDGLRLSTTSGIDGLTISNSNFDGNAYGFESYAVAGSSNPLTNVQITNTTFSNDTFKGFYAEKLDHATLDHVTVTNSGTGASSPAGIDINLKYADFSNITLSNSTITNSGTGTAGGLGLTIKARDDAPSYNTNPATLTGVTLTNDSITGSPTDLAIGNHVTGLAFAGLVLGGTGLGLTYYAMPAQALSVGDASFAGTLSGYITNQTANLIDAISASFGGVTGTSATPAQEFAIEGKIIDYFDNNALGLVRIQAGSLFVPTGGVIQPAIDIASSGDVIYVQAGTYPESVNINKQVTLNLGGNITINSLTGIASSGVELNANLLTDGDAANTLYQGTISGVGGKITKIGSGTLALSGNNTYTGLTTISSGTIEAESNTALGSTAAGTTVDNGAALQLQGGMTVGEPLTLNGAGPGGLTGAVESVGGVNTWTGPITLGSNSTLFVDPGTSLFLSGAVDGAFGIITNIGAGGIAGFSGGVGTHVALASFTAAGLGTLELGGHISVSGNTTNINTPTILTADTSIADFGAINFNAGATVDGDGNGPWALALTTLNNATFADHVGFTNPLGAVTVSAVNLGVGSTFNAASLAVTTVTGSAIFDGALSLTGLGTNFSVDAIQLFIENTVNAHGGQIDWITDNIDIGGDISGTGSLTIEPLTLTRTIGINAPGLLNLTTAEIGHLQDGFSAIQIGGAAGAGLIVVDHVTFHDPTTLLSPHGFISVIGTITGLGDGGATLNAPAISLSVSEPAAAISTQSGGIAITGNVFLMADTKLATTGGDISDDGSINGAFDLNINAGSGTVNLNSSHLPVNASIGGSVRLNSVEVSGAVLNLQPLILTTGSQSYTGTSAINLHAGGMSSSIFGGISFTGPVVARNEIRITTAAFGDVDFNGTVDNDTSVFGAVGALNITAPGSTVHFHDDVGAGSPLVRVVVAAAHEVTADGDLRVSGDLSLTADDVSFLGGVGSVHGGGTLTLQPVVDSAGVHVGGGAIPGNLTPGISSTFNLTTSDLSALGDGFHLIDIGRVTGKAGLSIDSVGATFSDPVVFREITKTGGITSHGPLTGIGDAGFTFAGGTTTLSNDITTAGGSVLIGTAVVNHDINIHTHGGAITFSAQILDSAGGGDDLTFDAGSGPITLAGGIGKTNTPHFGAVVLNSTGLVTIGKSILATSFATGSGGTLELKGSITTTGAAGQTFNEAVILGASTTLTSNNAPIHFFSTVDSIPGKAYSLSAKAGTATVTFDGNLGATNVLSAISARSTGHVALNGNAFATSTTVTAHDFTVHGVTTSTGTQRYTGIGTYAGALTGKTLTISSSGGSVTSSAAWNFSGVATIRAGTHNIIVATGSNSFGTLTLGGATATVTESGAALLKNISLTGNLTLTAGGDVDELGSLRTGGLGITAGGAIHLDGINNTIHTLNAISADDGITILSGGANLTIASTLSTTTGDIVLASDMRKTRNNMINHGGSLAFSTPAGRFVLYTYREALSPLSNLPIQYSEVLGNRYPYTPPPAADGLNTVVYVVH